MSFLTKTLRFSSSPSLRLAARTPSTAHPRAHFHISTARASLNENDLGRDENERREEVDSHKNDQKNEQEEGKRKQVLGSASENAIKADRGETEHADKDIEQLQKETAKKANESARAK